MASPKEPPNAPSGRVIAFMPIKPKYVERILDGGKGYEFRRTRIRPDLTHIVIYSCFPVKKVVGIAEVESVDAGSPDKMWTQTRRAAGMSREEFMHYFEGARSAVAIALGKITALERGVCPSEVSEGFTVPQCYRYINEGFLERVVELGRQKRPPNR